jgi:hypothetical protein
MARQIALGLTVRLFAASAQAQPESYNGVCGNSEEFEMKDYAAAIRAVGRPGALLRATWGSRIILRTPALALGFE